jgi:hypothetical protein
MKDIIDLPPGMALEALPAIPLRDYFAANAAMGMTLTVAIANCPLLKPEEIATAAYAIADAMLAEREKK